MDGLLRQHALQEAQVCRDTGDAEAAQGPLRAPHRFGETAGGRVHDHLGQQRVEARVGAIAGIAVVIDAHARSSRWIESG